MVFNPDMVNPSDATSQIQIAMKNVANNFVFYFSISIDFDSILLDGVALDVNSFASAWKSLNEAGESSAVVKGKLNLLST